MADQVPVNVNYAWKAIRASSFLSGDTQLAEFAMAVTGTLIVTSPTSDSDTSGPRVRILEPLALDRRVTETLMEGGGALPVYRCDTPNLCLNPSLGTVTIPANRGFRARVASLLRDLVDAVRTDTAPPAAALGLVNLTTLPVYRVANAAAAYRGAVIDQEMDALAEAVALDVMQVWITDLHRTVEERAGHARHRRRRAAPALARGSALESDCARPAPSPGPPAAQHGARRGREAEADRDRAGRSAVGGPAGRAGIRARRRRRGFALSHGVTLNICTSSSPLAAAPISSTC